MHPIKMQRIEMKKGDILMFRGDLVHSGSKYEKSNIRLHCFMDSGFRTPNRTYLIHTHASEHMRQIIDVDY
jgi:ectoine hydroxylase-related dioxygenase (phytanoyl-CoA dioxygenase family)